MIEQIVLQILKDTRVWIIAFRIIAPDQSCPEDNCSLIITSIMSFLEDNCLPDILPGVFVPPDN